MGRIKRTLFWDLGLRSRSRSKHYTATGGESPTNHRFMYLRATTPRPSTTTNTARSINTSELPHTHKRAAARSLCSIPSAAATHSPAHLHYSLRLVWGVFSLTLTFPSLSQLSFPQFETNSRLTGGASLPWARAPRRCRPVRPPPQCLPPSPAASNAKTQRLSLRLKMKEQFQSLPP